MAFEWNRTGVWTSEDVEEFIKSYSDSLIRYAFCIIRDSQKSEEIVLDVIADFVIRSESKPLGKAYLYRMLKSRCVDRLRFHRRFVPLEDIENVCDVNQNVEKRLVDKEEYKTLYLAMNKINPDYRQVLFCYYLEDLDLDSICQVMRKSKKQTYNLLFRAKAALKEELSKENFIYEKL